MQVVDTSTERLLCPLMPHHDNFLGEITSTATSTRGDTQVPRWPDNPLLISPISNSDDATKRLLYWGRAVTPRYFVPGPPERGRRRGRETLGDSKWGEGQPKSSSSYSYSYSYSPSAQNFTFANPQPHSKCLVSLLVKPGLQPLSSDLQLCEPPRLFLPAESTALFLDDASQFP
jgi:hypothetical protein